MPCHWLRTIPLILLLAAGASRAQSFFCAGRLAPRPAARRLALADAEPVTGRLRMLVVFARFADDTPAGQPPAWSTSLLDPVHPGSVAHFYDTMSAGRFEVRGEVAPGFYTSTRQAALFAAEDPNQRGPYGGFVAEVLAAVDRDVDLARFDGDGDGIVDHLSVVVLSAPPGFLHGPATGIADLGLTEAFVSDDRGADGRAVAVTHDRGSVQVAANAGLAAGSISHELAHHLGAADLFGGSPNLPPQEQSAGIGRWGLMGWGAQGWRGDDGPNPFCAWTRVLLGWAQMVDILQESSTLRLRDVTGTGQVARVRMPGGRTWFLLESRRRGATYDRHTPGEGLLIWHVDPFRGTVDLECADGRWLDAAYPAGLQPDPDRGGDNLDFWSRDGELARALGGNQGDATDPFDGVRFRRFGPDTNPAAWDEDGRWSFALDDLRFDNGIAVAELTVPPYVRLEELNLRGGLTGDVAASGQRLEIDLTLSGPPIVQNRSLSVTLSPPRLPAILQHATASLTRWFSGDRANYSLPGRSALAFTVKADGPGLQRDTLRLDVVEMGPDDLRQTVWRIRVPFAVVDLDRLHGVPMVRDSLGNGDARVQLGEIVSLEVGLDALADLPQVRARLDLALHSLDPRVVPLRVSRLQWLTPAHAADSSARLLSGSWLVGGDVVPGSRLPFVLEMTADASTWRDTLRIPVVAGADPSAPLVGAPLPLAVPGGLRVILPDARLQDGSAVLPPRVTVQTAGGAAVTTVEMARKPHRHEATLSGLTPGDYRLRVGVTDASGNASVGPLASATVIAGALPASGRLAASAFLRAGVESIAWSPDGALLAVASGTDVVLLGDPRLETRAVFGGHRGAVTEVCFAPDGSVLASAAVDGSVRLWDPEGGGEVAVVETGAAIQALALGEGGRLAVATPTEILVWEPGRWSAPWRRLGEGGVGALALHPQGILLAGRADGRIRSWHLASMRPAAVRDPAMSLGHGSILRRLSLSADGATLVSGDAAGGIGVWAFPAGSGSVREGVHADGVTDLDLQGSTGLLASTASDGVLRVENTRRTPLGVPDEVLREVLAGAQTVSLHPDGRRVAAGTWDGGVHVYLLGSDAAAQPVSGVDILPAYPNPFNGGVWIPYRLRRNATVEAKVYDVTGQLVRRLRVPSRRAGTYAQPSGALHWDGADEAGRAVASGVYFVSLEAGRSRDVARVLLLR